jgi:hypothetical protein
VRDGKVDALYNVMDHKLVSKFETNFGGTFNNLFGLADNGTTMYGVAGNDIYRVDLATAHLMHLSSDLSSGIAKASGASFVGG